MAKLSDNKTLKKCRSLQVLKGFVFAFLIFTFTFVYAEKTVKTVEYPLNYISQPSANTNYMKNITVVSPDGISEILSFEVFLQGDFQANTDVKFRIRHNGNLYDCEPNTWTTPNLDAVSYKMSFDCTNLVEQYDWKGGKVELGFRTNKVAQNIKPRLKITYLNNPQGDLNVWGTEYEFGQQGTVWVQLKDENGDPEPNGTCHVDVYYPNMPNSTHNIWLDDVPLLYLEGSDGLYYYDFTIPNDIEGVYMMSARCSYIYESEWYYDDLENDPNRTVLDGTYTGDSVVLNLFNDYVYTKCYSTTDVNKRCKVEYTWIVDNTNISEMDVFWMGETDNDVLMEFYVYNWTSDEYVKLPNDRETEGTGYNYPIGVNELISNSIPLDGTISDSNEVKILMNSTAGRVFILHNNWLTIRTSQQGDFIQDIKGSGEIHVSTTNITGSVVGDFLGNITGDITGDVTGVVHNVANANASWDELVYAGATEYLTGTTGTVSYQYIKVQAGNPVPVNDALCNTTIWFPNNTMWIQNASLTYLPNSYGVYTYDFTVPDVPVSGVYRTHAVCYDAPKYTYSASTFHVEDSLYNNQQTMYNFIQAMNTTMVSNQNYIISLVNNVSTQIDDKWSDFWDTARARMVN